MKLIASDFDGTLYFYNESPSIRIKDIQAIKEFQNKGNMFGICSGRNFHGIDDQVNGLIDLDFYILNNGGLILDHNHQVIKEYLMSIDNVLKILNRFKEIESMIVIKDTVYLYKHTRGWENPHFVFIDDYNEIKEKQIQSFSFHLPDEKKASIVTQEINSMNLGIQAFQNRNDIDCINSLASKGHGIKIVQEYYSMNVQDIFTIGDSYNDIPMLKENYTSFTFYSSPDAVKKEADKLVNSISECIKEID